MGELLPTNGIRKRYYYETVRLNNPFTIGSPFNGFIHISHNNGEMLLYVSQKGNITKIFSSADEIFSVTFNDGKIVVSAIIYDLIIIINCLEF